MNPNSPSFQSALMAEINASRSDPNMESFATDMLLHAAFMPVLKRQQVIDLCYATWHPLHKDWPSTESLPEVLSQNIRHLAKTLKGSPKPHSLHTLRRIGELRDFASLARKLTVDEATSVLAMAFLFRAAPEGAPIDDFFRIGD